MKQDVVDIQFWGLLAAYVFIIILIILVRLRGMNREKRIILSTFRMTIQLVIVGYILTYIFENPHPIWTLFIIGIMESFAIYNIYKQVQLSLHKKLKKIIAISMITGSLITLFYFNFIVIHFKPWYDPQYFIPIAGMIIGNSMTGITLGIKSFVESFLKQKQTIEAALMLGAKPETAVKPLINSSFDAAILPTINSMVGMGIVFLPGMMTGQILSGTSPLLAIEYQIVVLLGIAGSVGITVFFAFYFGYKTFFNDRSQLL